MKSFILALFVVCVTAAPLPLPPPSQVVQDCLLYSGPWRLSDPDCYALFNPYIRTDIFGNADQERIYRDTFYNQTWPLWNAFNQLEDCYEVTHKRELCNGYGDDLGDKIYGFNIVKTVIFKKIWRYIEATNGHAQLVEHCFKFHFEGKPNHYGPCKGISFDLESADEDDPDTKVYRALHHLQSVSFENNQTNTLDVMQDCLQYHAYEDVPWCKGLPWHHYPESRPSDEERLYLDSYTAAMNKMGRENAAKQVERLEARNALPFLNMVDQTKIWCSWLEFSRPPYLDCETFLKYNWEKEDKIEPM